MLSVKRSAAAGALGGARLSIYPICVALGMAGDDWGWLGEGGDGGDGSFVTEITYGKLIN